MDDVRFDALAKTLGQRPSRRQLLRGVLGLGGAAAVATVIPNRADAQWSVQVCMPNGSGGYTLRLVPKSSVSLYQRKYGAIPAEGGTCGGGTPSVQVVGQHSAGGADNCFITVQVADSPPATPLQFAAFFSDQINGIGTGDQGYVTNSTGAGLFTDVLDPVKGETIVAARVYAGEVSQFDLSTYPVQTTVDIDC
jgi:hypothetical protein